MVARRSRYDVTDDWTASWIWCEGESHPRNFHIYARRGFKLPAMPTQATLRITADSRYRLYVNGNYVGWGAANSFTRRLTYDTYDIAPFLVKGQNSIAVLVYHLGHPASNYVPRRAALICEADIAWKDGGEKIVTDETWRVLPAEAWTNLGGRVCRNLGYQQVFDARIEVEGWNEAKFNDSKWPAAMALGEPPTPPLGRLSPREIPKAVEQIVRPVEVVSIYDAPPMPEDIIPPDVPRFISSEELRPITDGRVDKPERLLQEGEDATMVRVPSTGGVSVILDFGRQVYGSLDLALSKVTSGVLDIAYDESIGQSGLRPDRGGIRYTDRVIMRKGKQEWSSFEPRAFRYVQLEFRECPKPFAINHVFVRDAAFPMELLGSFESNDASLNQIWKNGIESVRRSLMDTYIDTPWRDRSPSLADIIASIKPAYYAFGEVPLLEERLRHIAASQRRDGALLALHPGVENRVFVDLAMLWVIAVWDNYSCGGDKNLLADLYPTVDRLQQWIGRFVDDDGLLCNVHADLFLDWGKVNRHGEIAGLSCLYLGALVAMRGMADALGRAADADEFARMASGLKASIGRNFWSPSRGLYSDVRVGGRLDEHYSRPTNILAARFDVPDHYQRSSILRQMVDDHGLPQVSSKLLTSMLIDSMCRSGDVDEALDFIRRSVGKHDASEPPSPTATYQLQAYLLGVASTDVTGKMRIEPHVCDLVWVRGTVPTPNGPVKVGWKTGPRGFSMDIELPDGVTAEVVPPSHDPRSHVTIDRAQMSGAFVELGPGAHNLSVTPSGRTRRPGPPVEIAVAEASERMPVPPGRGDIETVEQMIQILTQMEKEQLFVVEPTPDGAETIIVETRKPSRRRGRGGRGRRDEEVARDTDVEETEPDIEDEEYDPFAEREEKVEAVSEQEPAAEEHRPKRRRRRGKGRGATEQAVATTEEPEVTETPAVDDQPMALEQEPAPEHRPKRRRRRGRGRGATSETVAQTLLSVQADAGQTGVPVPLEAEASPEEPPAGDQPIKRSRRRRRRGGRSHGSTVPTEETSHQEVVEPIVEAVRTEEPSEAPAEERKPRSRRRRSPRAAESTAQVEETPAPAPEPPVEAHMADSEAAGSSKPPRRRRRGPSSKPTEGQEQTSEAPSPVSNGNDEASPAKPRRRRSSPRKAAGEEG